MKNSKPVCGVLCAIVAVSMFGCSGKKVSTQTPVDTESYDVTGQLNDTGILLCSSPEQNQVECPQDDLPQQDAEFGRDALAALGTLPKVGAGVGGFDWIKLGAFGEPLAKQGVAWSPDGTEQDGSRWSCVLDNVTELMWEVKESSPEHPRYADHSYSWWLESEQENGGFAGHRDGGTCGTPDCDTQSYLEWVNDATLCSYSDWRLPTVAELASIAVLSNVIPAVDAGFFPNVSQPRYFTNESAARDPSRAWYVYFSDGSVSFTNKSDVSQIRLVRGGQQ